MAKQLFNLGDIFVDEEGAVFQYMKINSEGEPNKHADFPYRIESLKGVGFWDAYKTKESADEYLGVLVDEGYFQHYTDWSITLRGNDGGMSVFSQQDIN
jgi:hypothetical protein